MPIYRSVTATAALVALTSPALAHQGHHGDGGLLTTVSHYILSSDHLLPSIVGVMVVVVGLIAFRAAGRKPRI